MGGGMGGGLGGEDPRVANYVFFMCKTYCFLSFLILTLPFGYFLIWPYSLLVWVGTSVSVGAVLWRFGRHAINPHLLLTVSLGCAGVSLVFATLLANYPGVALCVCFAVSAGVTWGTLSVVIWHVHALRRELRQEALLVG